ncbi:MAG TPA: sugar phosphate nucleotidyltransferase, partial [Actinomycetota bacterium]|nr:sugar phosphate nucleotidyltransferase [Actinomycetota bacterium]
MSVRTAVIPAAGLGTRFLPATKVLPKGLLPVVDTPAIQLVVEEALAAGCEDVILVIGPGQDDLLRHFAPAPELEAELTARGKTRELELVGAATVEAVRSVVQTEARGLGHAVAQAAG